MEDAHAKKLSSSQVGIVHDGMVISSEWKLTRISTQTYHFLTTDSKFIITGEITGFTDQ